MASKNAPGDAASIGTGTVAGGPHPHLEGRAVTDVPAESNEQNEPRERETRQVTPVRSRRSGGGLRFYKPSQGYYTRICTAVGGAVLVLWGAAALYDQLAAYMDAKTKYYNPVTYGLTVAFVLAMGAVIYWLVGLSVKPNDFFIATEGEMKKVSWSSRREVIRSTKVVIVSVVLLGAMLFIADIFFMWFFSAIKVLKAFPGIGSFFGSNGS